MIIEYQALNNTGSIVTDTLMVDDVTQVQAELSNRGLVPISVKTGTSSAIGRSGLKDLLTGLTNGIDKVNPKRASRRELPFFTAQLAILLETGTPVAASLTAIERQLTNPHWRMIVAQMRQHVEEGGTLTSAASLYPHIFDSVFTSMISAGETSGNLSEILNRLADLSRQADRLKSKLISAMIYPALLTLISLAVMMILIFFVLPRFVTVFEELNVKLPATTKALLSVSSFAREYTLLAAGLLSAVIVSIVFALRSKSGKRFRTRTLLKIPIAGPLSSALINARIFRLMGLLIESSVPLLDALELTRTATVNYLYTDLIGRMHTSVLNGCTMNEVMLTSKLIPPSIAQMVQTGEENGQ
ncbi:MAG: type II secretion system F family protein, partial [Sedimentisphaerales bacterium]|nr:type II secretion system F family protein [Sedimentisphaerales bacterium]